MALWSSLGIGAGPAATATVAAVGIAAAVGTYVLVFGDARDPAPVVFDAPKAPLSQTSLYVPGSSSQAPVVTTATPTTKFGSTDETGGTPPTAVVTDTALIAPNLGARATLLIGEGTDMSVSATVIGNQVVASADPNSTIGLDTQSADVPQVGAAAKAVVDTRAPTFDLVRVDKYGGALIAGKTVPGQKIQILMDGTIVADTIADVKGNFVALFDVPASQDPQVLSMVALANDGQKILSPDSVIVVGREVIQPDTPASETAVAVIQDVAPAIIVATQEGIKVVQPLGIVEQAPDVLSNVTIDVISYDHKGEVVLTGRSTVDKHVRVYVNDQPIKTEAVNSDGSWELSLPEVDAGRYTLRIDEIDGAGQVTSRVETPFQKEQADDVRRTASIASLEDSQSAEALPQIQKVTVQPGATLWALAQTKYGDGRLYLQIVKANSENIKNPDLIYPGQIFTIPD